LSRRSRRATLATGPSTQPRALVRPDADSNVRRCGNRSTARQPFRRLRAGLVVCEFALELPDRRAFARQSAGALCERIELAPEILRGAPPSRRRRRPVWASSDPSARGGNAGISVWRTSSGRLLCPIGRATRDDLLFARSHGMRPRNDLVRRDTDLLLGRVRQRRHCPCFSLSLEEARDLTANAPEDPRDDKADQEREGSQRKGPDRDPHPKRHLTPPSATGSKLLPAQPASKQRRQAGGLAGILRSDTHDHVGASATLPQKRGKFDSRLWPRGRTDRLDHPPVVEPGALAGLAQEEPCRSSAKTRQRPSRFQEGAAAVNGRQRG
jgi:hypothetical protein